ncbi:MAG TPA: ribonuclease R [Candidatus Dormibacteraeota bacterium]|nr:ribonuclease R [Candidatus Dormibacteraeota bacterium]
MRLPIPPPGQVRKAAQCTQGVGDCQLKGRRGQFGRREHAGTARKARVAHPPITAKSSREPPRDGKGPSARAAGPAAANAHVKSGSLVEGTVSANRAGYGFVRVEGLKESVFLPPPEMRGVMHGDRLRVKVTRDGSDRWSGTVQAVLERGVSAFLGTVEVQGRSVWVNAADRRLQLRCAVASQELHGARSGDWVIARITRHAGSASAAEGVIVKRLDPDRPVELATESAIARFDLPHEFPAAALREAQAFGDRVDAREAEARTDLRDLPLVTIDGEDARDFDDAVYAEPHAAGFRLIVAIADVSHYVRPGTAVDTEAVARGTSVYFPTRVLPMLPTALSDHLCSLAPHVDRLCFAADMVVSRNGALKSARFYPAVMRSAARLTYTLANEALFEGRPAARTQLGPLTERLLVLVDVYRALYKARAHRGALDFDAAEAEFVIDAGERVRAIELRARNQAHRLIEECMIMANVAVAQALAKAHTPTLYRVHGQPEDEKLERLAATLTALGIDARIPKSVTTRDLQALARRVGDAPERAFIESLVVRAMPQAIYQPTNIGHFGLALTHYAHFTSPIRRYPDLIVHRTLKALIGAQGGAGVHYSAPQLAALGESTSRLEKRADEADRYVSNFLKCTYLRERIGQTFQGLITTVVEFGCFVQILDVAVDGLLHLDNLRDDQYVMEEDGHAWRGRRNGRRLRTGAHVRVVVSAVNPIEGLIDLALAE